MTINRIKAWYNRWPLWIVSLLAVIVWLLFFVGVYAVLSVTPIR